jgi:hypothetical protein
MKSARCRRKARVLSFPRRYSSPHAGKEVKLTKLLANEEFYKERFETEDFFTKNCETGDVILFQDDHFFAKAQRFFTRSNFGTSPATQVVAN